MAVRESWSKENPLKAGDIVDDDYEFLRIGTDGRWYWRDLEDRITFSSSPDIKTPGQVYDAFETYKADPQAFFTKAGAVSPTLKPPGERIQPPLGGDFASFAKKPEDVVTGDTTAVDPFVAAGFGEPPEYPADDAGADVWKAFNAFYAANPDVTKPSRGWSFSTEGVPDPTIDPETNEPWDPTDAAAVARSKMSPEQLATLLGIPLSAVNTGNGSATEGDDPLATFAGASAASFDTFAQMEEAKKWIKAEQKKGLFGVGVVTGTDVPLNWEKLSEGTNLKGEFNIPRNVVAYWYMTAVGAKNDELIRQRDEAITKRDKNEADWNALSQAERLDSKKGTALKAQFDEWAKKAAALSQLQTQSQQAVGDAPSIFQKAIAGELDFGALTKSYGRFGQDLGGNFTGATTTAAVTAADTAAATGADTAAATGAGITLYNKTTGDPIQYTGNQDVVDFLQDPKNAHLSLINPNAQVDPWTGEVAQDPDAPPMINGQPWDGTQEQAQKILAEQQLAGQQTAAQQTAAQQTAAQATGDYTSLADFYADAAATPGGGFDPATVRQMSYEMQTPFDAFTRMGLQGELLRGRGEGDQPGQPVSTTELSQFAQGALSDYFNRQLEPGYALALAQASETGQAPAFQGGQDYPTFESFARQQMQDPGVLGQEDLIARRKALLSTLGDQTRVTDPYRQALMGYFGGPQGLENIQNERLLSALNAPTLSRIAPRYRRGAASQMQGALQRQMLMQPERKMLSFYSGDPFATKADALVNPGLSELFAGA